QIFHCFGCHKGGDVFTFVKDYENIGFMDAVRRLAERAKIPLEFENTPGAQESRHLKDQLLDIHEQLTQRWQNCLANEAAGQVARDYLARRGVSAEAIKLFRIGAAPELWDDTVNWAHSKKFELEVVEKAGLIIRKEETGRHYDRFRGRLMFPICDEQGRVVGFSGRVLSGDEKTAKYVNSPETPIFTKSKIFFGLDKSKRAILDAGYAIICEGQLDLIACYMAGVQNIVAPQGTAFTDQHARILKRYASEVVLCFDSDNAGNKATVRSLEGLLVSQFAATTALSFEAGGAARDTLLSSGLAIRVAVLPSPHDPDSFIKSFGSAAFQKLISEAPSFFDFYLNYLCSTNDIASDRGKSFIAKSMADLLHKTGNMVLVDTYAQKTAQRLIVSADAMRKEFSKAKPQTAYVREDDGPDDSALAGEAEAEAPSRQSNNEWHLLKILLLHESMVGWAVLNLDPNWLAHPFVRQIVDARLAACEHETWHSLTEFMDGIESPLIRSLITEAVADERQLPSPETQIADVTLKLRNQFLDQQIATLTQKISQPELDDATRLEFLHEQQRLKQQKRLPLAPLER
ncbi:MAG: DNA primase, partial [Verrucomicrobia bacterium]|nr:DNA primase [Verrucomicrobiota bacterium]